MYKIIPTIAMIVLPYDVCIENTGVSTAEND